jgi:hypothetical protein
MPVKIGIFRQIRQYFYFRRFSGFFARSAENVIAAGYIRAAACHRIIVRSRIACCQYNGNHQNDQ